MERVVSHRGLGFVSDSEQLTVAGKTGWVQLQTISPTDTISVPVEVASFCGYFPVDHPRYTCLVSIYNSKVKMGSGGKIAVPIFKKVSKKIDEIGTRN